MSQTKCIKYAVYVDLWILLKHKLNTVHIQYSQDAATFLFMLSK